MDRASSVFTPLRLRDIEIPNRVMVSPMCMYAAADGIASDYHLVHLGRFALGGAGLVVVEATGITAQGRISHHDLGLWNDEQADALARVATFLKAHGSIPGIQLAHAGRKASTTPPWERGRPLVDADAASGLGPWPVIGPSAVSAGPGWPVPHELDERGIAESIRAWGDAARRARAVGFEVIDLHGAHGYLLHSFLSPISNTRGDRYGGDLEGRMRYPLEVVRAVRAAIGDEVALFYRMSVTDGVEGGITLDDSILFARALGDAGVDLIDVSSGGIVTDRAIDTRVRRGFAFHAPFSGPLRAATGLPVATVGLVVDALQAQAIIDHGDADLVALGREMLHDPNWAHHARASLDLEDWERWHREAAWALAARHASMARLRESGESPMTRYSG
ncbi:NADH:flavin oxidoreductase/NADH oxidase [Leifsonia sp. H3M29-4]|uniref:NADH:flavin oxidoreductase/NADH oxidase n=1 Tax=Salinibacterium metalliresistens TaxID=3031321 RepID=UPI0023DAF6AE|nr:NADH:flavin oxidoreductase/NADH oxidase [Salinibacterium metalliresistens]MDF1478506.1 NADH:flavin oxidoreductase/NADH oxidase [Salinibacterium metalliresistens]